MKKIRFLFAAVLFFSAVLGAAQTSNDQSLNAMQNYRMGRDMESRGLINDANVYYNEAIRISQDEISRNAVTPDTYAALTWALQRQSRYSEVISWGERGLRVFPNEYRVVEIMGEAYFYLGSYNRSLSFMQRYANAMPGGEKIATVYFFIGEIYRLTQKYLHADIAYTTAVRLEPSLALWWYRLASVREEAGDAAPAREAYQTALRLDPNHRLARELARLGNR